MFESGEELNRNEGLRGIFTRHFSPVVDRDLARDGIHAIAHALIFLAGCTALLGTYLYGSGALLAAAAIGIPAVVLRFKPSRVAVIVLVTLTAMNAVYSLPQIMPWLWVLFALRGAQLTFGYHRLQKDSKVSEMVNTFD